MACPDATSGGRLEQQQQQQQQQQPWDHPHLYQQQQQQQQRSCGACCPDSRQRCQLCILELKASKIFDALRPSLRGIPDVFASAAALPAAALLFFHAHGSMSATAALVYGLAVAGMFCVSAVYHAIVWPLRTRLRLRRLDHSMVFVLIAGSYTPLCLTVLPHAYGRAMLSVVWSLAAAGVVKAWLWDDAPRALNTAIYMLLGWMVFPLAPVVVRQAPPGCAPLLLAGGLLFSIGGMVFQHKWPNPFPKTFAHHEVFHAFLIAAVCCHYRAMWMMVSNPPVHGTLAAIGHSTV